MGQLPAKLKGNHFHHGEKADNVATDEPPLLLVRHRLPREVACSHEGSDFDEGGGNELLEGRVGAGVVQSLSEDLQS